MEGENVGKRVRQTHTRTRTHRQTDRQADTNVHTNLTTEHLHVHIERVQVCADERHAVSLSPSSTHSLLSRSASCSLLRSLSRSLSLSHTHTRTLSLILSLSICPSLSLALSLSLSRSVALSLALCLFRSLLPLSHSCSLTQYQWPVRHASWLLMLRAFPLQSAHAVCVHSRGLTGLSQCTAGAAPAEHRSHSGPRGTTPP